MKYKGQLEGFPEHIIELMLQRQEEQTGIRDIEVFKEFVVSSRYRNGFNWADTPEGLVYWNEVIGNQNFDYQPPQVDIHKVIHTGEDPTTGYGPILPSINDINFTDKLIERSSDTTVTSGLIKAESEIRTVDEILRSMSLKEAQNVAMESDYAFKIAMLPRNDDYVKLTADASAFFLEGYQYAQKLMKDAKVLCHVVPELSKPPESVEMWVARDKFEHPSLHISKPERMYMGFVGGYLCNLPDNLFPSLTFENSPQKVRLTLIGGEK